MCFSALACVVPSVFATAARASAAETVLAVFPARSHASFAVQHLYVQRVVGTVPILRGSVAYEGFATVPSHIEATLDPKGIKTHDDDRDDDLQGTDWFDVQRFPTWTFASTTIVAAAGGFTVQGIFTAHGVAAPITLDVTTVRGMTHPANHATAGVDRHAFGMRVTPMDGVIGNELDIELDYADRWPLVKQDTGARAISSSGPRKWLAKFS